jgi:hypothetical protein
MMYSDIQHLLKGSRVDKRHDWAAQSESVILQSTLGHCYSANTYYTKTIVDNFMDCNLIGLLSKSLTNFAVRDLQASIPP